jgi:hypothetical protein
LKLLHFINLLDNFISWFRIFLFLLPFINSFFFIFLFGILILDNSLIVIVFSQLFIYLIEFIIIPTIRYSSINLNQFRFTLLIEATSSIITYLLKEFSHICCSKFLFCKLYPSLFWNIFLLFFIGSFFPIIQIFFRFFIFILLISIFNFFSLTKLIDIFFFRSSSQWCFQLILEYDT